MKKLLRLVADKVLARSDSKYQQDIFSVSTLVGSYQLDSTYFATKETTASLAALFGAKILERPLQGGSGITFSPPGTIMYVLQLPGVTGAPTAGLVQDNIDRLGVRRFLTTYAVEGYAEPTDDQLFAYWASPAGKDVPMTVSEWWKKYWHKPAKAA